MEKLNANDMCIHENGYVGIVKADIWRSNSGDIHRDGDQPAIISEDGAMYWYSHGKIHRDGDQPAQIFNGGGFSYMKHGMYHRDTLGADGLLLPAESVDGHLNYFLHGVQVDRSGNTI